MTTPQPLEPALRELLLAAPTAGLSAQLRALGIQGVSIEGVTPVRPGAKLVGVARTLRYLPLREDLFREHGGGYNAQKRLFDDVGEGEVIVIEARGDSRAGTLGDILAARAVSRGAAGIVTDGAVRDVDALAALTMPVFALAGHPAVLGRAHVPWEHDVTIACGGATVQPGDVIVGDTDGVIVIPRGMVDKVVTAALVQEEEDAWVAARVSEGHPLDGLFPMNADWRARYEASHPAGEER